MSEPKRGVTLDVGFYIVLMHTIYTHANKDNSINLVPIQVLCHLFLYIVTYNKKTKINHK